MSDLLQLQVVVRHLTRVLGTKLGPSEEQQVLFSDKPSLQPPLPFFFF